MTTLDIPRGKERPALDSQLRTVLTEAVNASGLSRREIARRAGLHRTTVCYVLNGQRTGLIDTWDLILTAAGVQLGYRIVEEAVDSQT